jgi:putative transposase
VRQTELISKAWKDSGRAYGYHKLHDDPLDQGETSCVNRIARLANAVAESFLNLLKRERIRRNTYRTRNEARQDVFEYIEMFYNPKRKHVRNGMLSPVEFKRQQT